METNNANFNAYFICNVNGSLNKESKMNAWHKVCADALFCLGGTSKFADNTF